MDRFYQQLEDYEEAVVASGINETFSKQVDIVRPKMRASETLGDGLPEPESIRAMANYMVEQWGEDPPEAGIEIASFGAGKCFVESVLDAHPDITLECFDVREAENIFIGDDKFKLLDSPEASERLARKKARFDYILLLIWPDDTNSMAADLLGRESKNRWKHVVYVGEPMHQGAPGCTATLEFFELLEAHYGVPEKILPCFNWKYKNQYYDGTSLFTKDNVYMYTLKEKGLNATFRPRTFRFKV